MIEAISNSLVQVWFETMACGQAREGLALGQANVGTSAMVEPQRRLRLWQSRARKAFGKRKVMETQEFFDLKERDVLASKF